MNSSKNSEKIREICGSRSNARQLKPFLTGTGPTRKNTSTKTSVSSSISSSSGCVSKIVLTGSLPTIQSKRNSINVTVSSHPVSNSQNQLLTRYTKNNQKSNANVLSSRRQAVSTSNLNSTPKAQTVDRSDTFTKQTINRRPSKSQSLWLIKNHSHQASVWRQFSSVSNQIVPKNDAKTFTTKSNQQEKEENKAVQNSSEVNPMNTQDSAQEWNNVRPRSFSFSTLNILESLEKEYQQSESRPTSSEPIREAAEPPCEGKINHHQNSNKHSGESATCDMQTSPTLPPSPSYQSVTNRLEKTKSMTSVGTQVEMNSRSELSTGMKKSKSNHDNVVLEPEWEFEYDMNTGRLVKRVLPNQQQQHPHHYELQHQHHEQNEQQHHHYNQQQSPPKSVSSPTFYRNASIINSRYSSGFSDFQACQRCKDSNCCETIQSMQSSRKSSLTHNEFDDFYNFDSQTSLNQTAMSVPYINNIINNNKATMSSSSANAPASDTNIRTTKKPPLIEDSYSQQEKTFQQTPRTKIDSHLQANSEVMQSPNVLTSTLSSSHPKPYMNSARNQSIVTQPEKNNRFEALLRSDSFLHNAVHQVKNSVALANRKTSTFEQSKGGIPTGPVQVINDHPQGVNCLELSEDRSLLISGGEDAIVRLWSTHSTPCECIGILVGHLSYITCATVYKLLVISGSADCTIRLWSIEDGNCLMTLNGHSAFINRVVCVGSLLLSSSFDATVRIWVLSDALTIIQHENVRRASETSSVNKNSSRNTSKDDQNESGLLKKKTVNYSFGAHLQTLAGHQKSVTQVALVPNELALLESGVLQELDIIVTTSTDGTARTWCLTNGEERHVLYGHTGPINCLVSDRNEGQIVYTAGSDAVIKCWDIVTGEHLRDLKGHQSAVLCLISNNRILYSCSADHTVRAWAMEFGQCTRIYYRNTSSVTCCAYLRGILYTGSNDHSARIYDANSGVLRQTNSGHENAISAIAVVPGKLFTASFDGNILVWDVSAIQNEIASADTTINDNPRTIFTRKKTVNALSSKIGATILNSTLDIFTQDYAQKLKNGPGKRTKSTLYPHLRRKSNTQAEATANRVIKKTLGDKKGFNSNGSGDSSGPQKSWIGAMFRQRLWSCKSESDNEKLSERLKRLNLTRNCQNKSKTNDFTSEIDPGVLALIEQQSRFNKRLGVNVTPNEDSMNVQRAVTALEPYLRSFK